MENTNYKITLPVSEQKSIEITTINTPVREEKIDGAGKIRIFKSCNMDGGGFKEIDSHEKMPEDLLRLIGKSREILNRCFTSRKPFMATTLTGFHVFHADQVVCFIYLAEKKQWSVLLNNQSSLLLKKNTNTKDILNYAPTFFKINQRQIINLDYLQQINNKICKLTVCTGNNDELVISRLCLKTLQQYIKVI